MPVLRPAKPAEAVSLLAEGHGVWGAGLSKRSYGSMWLELASSPWGRRWLRFMVWVGEEEVQDFFRRSIAASEMFRERVEALLAQEEGSVERVVAIIKSEQYDTNKQTKQPEQAYLLNLRAQVSHLADRLSQRS